MCDFCKNKKDVIVPNGCNDYGGKFSICGNKLYFETDEDGEFKTKINYCPMCGVKLGCKDCESECES